MSGKVLLVIDMLNDFVQENGTLYCGAQVAKIINKVIDIANDFINQNEPIIFIMDSHEPNDIEFDRFPKHCVQGTPGAELIQELADITDRGQRVFKVTKNRYSGFFNTDLESILNHIQPEEVHVVGVCTNICVLYTVEELCNRNCKVFVYKEGVSSFDQKAHSWALMQMKTVLGAIII